MQLVDITTQVLFSKNFIVTRVCAHTSWLSERSLLQLDRPETVTKYKLVIPIKGIMILVFWEKSFKSLEANYSNRLAKSLVASCGEISPSPWICCDKIKLSYQRCQFLGTQKQVTPKERHTYLQPVHRELASLEDARTWCPEWIQWEHGSGRMG